jgi:hypothetical protein
MDVTDRFIETIGPRLESAGEVFILEKLASGGGATRWFHCETVLEVRNVMTYLRPGSRVGFFFDDRIRRRVNSPESQQEAVDLAFLNRELFVGQKDSHANELHMYLAEPTEVYFELAKVPIGQSVFFAAFPAFDDDGLNSFTFTPPDADGVTRPNPV